MQHPFQDDMRGNKLPAVFKPGGLWSGCRVASVCFFSKLSYYQLKSWKSPVVLSSPSAALLRDFSLS